MEFIVVIVVIFVVFFIVVSSIRSSNITKLQQDYTNALIALKNDPTNADLHAQVLYTGRILCNLLRYNRGVTLHDETQIANDIRAVTANASASSVPVSPSIPHPATVPPTRSDSLEHRINALKKMKENGLLTDAEFDQKRQEILDSI